MLRGSDLRVLIARFDELPAIYRYRESVQLTQSVLLLTLRTASRQKIHHPHPTDTPPVPSNLPPGLTGGCAHARVIPTLLPSFKPPRPRIYPKFCGDHRKKREQFSCTSLGGRNGLRRGQIRPPPPKSGVYMYTPERRGEIERNRWSVRGVGVVDFLATSVVRGHFDHARPLESDIVSPSNLDPRQPWSSAPRLAVSCGDYPHDCPLERESNSVSIRRFLGRQQDTPAIGTGVSARGAGRVSAGKGGGAPSEGAALGCLLSGHPFLPLPSRGQLQVRLTPSLG